MASLELRLPSELIGYSYVNLTIPVADDITPEQAARLHWEYNLRFLVEQQKISEEPVTEAQENAISEAAQAVVETGLPATKLDEHKMPATKDPDEAPWDKKTEATADKPWQKKPEFPNLFG